jgi:hypothetical protein
VGLGGFTYSCTWSTWSQTPELHQEIETQSTTTVSGVFCWLSKDPIGISGGLNQYVFCGNNPVNFTDPYGLFQAGMFWRGVAGAGVSVIGMVAGAAATPTGALTGPGAALAYVSAYSFGANVGNIVNAFRDVPEPSPTGPVGTVATLATDNRTVQTAANITDAVIPLVLAGRIEWSRLPTQPGGLPGSLPGTLQRVPMNPSVAYPALRAYEYGYLGLQGYDYLIDPALDALNNPHNDDPCK